MSNGETVRRVRASVLSGKHAPVEPPVLRGMSGVVHTFSLLVTSNGRHCAFDIYDGVRQSEVLKTHIKILDTRASGYIIDVSSTAAHRTREVAREYGMALFTAQDIDDCPSLLPCSSRHSDRPNPKSNV